VQPPLAELREATGQVGQAVVETIIAATAGSQGPLQSAQREASVDNLDQAAQRFKEAVQDVETFVVAAPEESREAHAAEEVGHVRKKIEPKIR
jgi:NAD(P)H-dependent FMN reductase